MMVCLIVALFTLSAAGMVWCLVDGVKVNAGWQRGKGPIARYLDSRRRERFNLQLPETLATMSNALRAGFSITQAFQSVVDNGEPPIAEEFAIVLQQMRIGMSIEDSLEALSERVGSEDLTLVTTAILVSRKTGGNVTEIFDRIAETIRGRMRIERKVKSLTAQGRLQGVVVSLMPIFLGVIITMIRPDLMLPFLLSPVGLGAVVAMLLLVVFGWLMIRKIIRIDV